MTSMDDRQALEELKARLHRAKAHGIILTEMRCHWQAEAWDLRDAIRELETKIISASPVLVEDVLADTYFKNVENIKARIKRAEKTPHQVHMLGLYKLELQQCIESKEIYSDIIEHLIDGGEVRISCKHGSVVLSGFRRLVDWNTQYCAKWKLSAPHARKHPEKNKKMHDVHEVLEILKKNRIIAGWPKQVLTIEWL